MPRSAGTQSAGAVREVHAGSDRTLLGILLILGSVVTMAFADAMVKLVSADLSLWQVLLARSLVAIPLVVLLLWVRGGLVRRRPSGWSLLRSALLVATWLAFYASLPVLDLSVAAVAVYTNPILTALLSALVLGERVSGRQWVGVLLGFLGVLAILRPGSDAFSWFTFLPMLAAALYSIAMVLTRSKCREETSFGLALSLHVAFLLAAAIALLLLALLDLGPSARAAYPFLLGDWAPMGWRAWGLMALLGLLSAAYSIGVARAYQIAPPQIVATFDYGYLVSAALWGFVIFSERLEAMTLGGMVLITLAGLLVAATGRRPAGCATSLKEKAGSSQGVELTDRGPL